MTRPPFWNRDAHLDRQPFLRARGRMLRALRAWFDAEGFIEVDTAALQVSPGNEPHIQPFRTTLGPTGEGRTMYLHTSPEFACKKLLAAGESRLMTLTHVFRNGDDSPLHHPEFALLEWYRAERPLTALMDDCAALLRLAAEAAGSETMRWKGRTANPFAPPQILTVAEAFETFAGVDLLSTLTDPQVPDRDALAAQVAKIPIRIAPDDTWSDLFSKVLSDRVEPHLGLGRATILCDYPLPEAALAQPSPRDPRVAERFELYACGVELANAFGELTDPAVQRARFEADGALALARYGAAPPIDGDFLDALAHMPPASGIALGFDRLVMLATGASHIRQVIWTPVASGDDAR